MDLLIDGKNIVYTSKFINNDENSCCTFLRLLSSWARRFKPDRMNVFWDCPRDEVWRVKLYNEYKSSREDSVDGIDDMCEILYDVLSKCGVRQYVRDTQECDDLIYAFCEEVDEDIVVVSRDGDFAQLPWKFSNCRWYNLNKKKMVKPLINPLIEKCLKGDKSDNIKGYYGIGPKKAAKMANDQNKLKEFLIKEGHETFTFNLDLVDLARNPHISANKKYIRGVLDSTVKYNKGELVKSLINHKIRGSTSNLHSLFGYCKKLK